MTESNVYLVTDGHTDLYGVFASRELAQAYIDRVKAAGYPWPVVIEEMPLNVGSSTLLRYDRP